MWKHIDPKGAVVGLALLTTIMLVAGGIVMFNSGVISVQVKLPPAAGAQQ